MRKRCRQVAYPAVWRELISGYLEKGALEYYRKDLFMDKKTIGIIGGMGPLATVELFRLIVSETKSESDQEHIHILIDNNPQIPDRTNAILNNGTSPVPQIVASAKRLESMGADFLIMPCNTSHYFADEIAREINIKLLNMVEATVKSLAADGVKKFGLLATTGTVKGGVYSRFSEPLGLEMLLPNEEEQEEVMRFIYSGVKAGNVNYDVSDFVRIVDRLLDEGAETLILGCTELPLGKRMYGLDFPSLDTLKILAEASIIEAGYSLNYGEENEQIGIPS